ncbi:hypothetical protein [Halorussus aquaticus]|uniref:Uncharacterized protein n=1 Tax=Halorussus aquaticus TaxID=2953748 RepID=A0ABD5Q1Z0_9EURY|nr:hypothetical protein [Halorussus aquaticus]
MVARNESRTATLLGVLAAAVAVVGYVVFGWRFGGDSNPVALGFALLAVVAAVYFTVRSD